MTISKRNSRSININNETFRWVISPDSGYFIFVAEHSMIKGKRLEVYVESEMSSYWIDFPYVEQTNLRIIKPHAVRKMIIQTIGLGWDYREPGKPVVFDLKEENLVKRQST